MLRNLVYSVCLFAILFSCDEKTPAYTGECIAVSYLRGICGQAVLKIQDPKYFHLGEDADGDTNVFLAGLECFTDSNVLQKNTFYVELNPNDFNTNCAVCLAAVAYSGSKQYAVRVHETCSTPGF
ncbi:MAG: hypothetical protein KF725_15340 [Cyclobacteriaceae bacterium]|nr:hypothetical protein [Cyclobacteriaceae bacterium]UYN87717.1 MAG: hypothetical protein KIT51_05520 [Cyclobacteriaceae bacterium]